MFLLTIVDPVANVAPPASLIDEVDEGIDVRPALATSANSKLTQLSLEGSTTLHLNTHLTIVWHWMTGRWLRSLNGWMRMPRGSRDFFRTDSVSGILVNVLRKMSGEQLTLFHNSACNLGFGTDTGLLGRICLL